MQNGRRYISKAMTAVTPMTDALNRGQQLDLGDGILSFGMDQSAAVVSYDAFVTLVIGLAEHAAQAFSSGRVGFDNELTVEARHAQHHWLGRHSFN